MKILQLSDIHYGADYDGKFNTAKQFQAVLDHAGYNNSSGFDAVILTGDLVNEDSGMPEDEQLHTYNYILRKASDLCNAGTDGVYVVPGNHDNRKLLSDAAKDALGWYNDSDFNGGFSNPGSYLKVVQMGGKDIILLDSGNVAPYKGIATLGAYIINQIDSWNAEDTLLFTHTPFKTERLYHRFMKDNLMPSDVGELLGQYIRHYFCGHFHHLTHVECGNFDMHLCPGIQCQIDPYSKGCNAVAIPGYQVIEFSTVSNSDVVVHPVILDDYEA